MRLLILGSRSPRRLELLRQILPAGRIVVRAPGSSCEAGFEGLTQWGEIEARLLEIVRGKSDDVWRGVCSKRDGAATSLGEVVEAAFCRNVGLSDRASVFGTDGLALLTADTIVVAGGDVTGPLTVLGQPPEGDWQGVVRKWFLESYAGRTHDVATAFRIDVPGTAGGASLSHEEIVRTRVTFRPDVEPFLDWYLSTGESIGKAGGYALQGAGSLFVTRVEGSPSNVIGLPLAEVFAALRSVAPGAFSIDPPDKPGQR